MPTLKQIEAARRNGAKSKGHVTAEGKERSARNATAHGLSAKKFFVLANESEEKFKTVVQSFFDHHQPANDLEEELCLTIAHAYWRIRRLAIIETGIIDMEMLRQDEEVFNGAADMDEGFRLASAFTALTQNGGALAFVTRYETRLQRTFHQSIDRLEKMQRDRRSAEEAQKVRNEPKPETAAQPAVGLQNEPKPPRPTPVGVISQNEPNDSQAPAPSVTSDTIEAPDERRCA